MTTTALWMLRLSGGPYLNDRIYRVPMHKDRARSVAADFRRRMGCRVAIIPFEEA